MSKLDRIRAELKAEQGTMADPGEAPRDPQFEIDLAAALEQLEPSDAFVEALAALAGTVSPTVVRQRPTAGVGSPAIGFADLRVRHGLSEADAARMLDVSRDSLESLESKSGIGWTNLRPARVRQYLDRLGINPASLVRSIADQLPEGPAYAFGYRPRTVAEEPLAVEATDDDRERLISWGHELYRG
jgi:hypothetical protein